MKNDLLLAIMAELVKQQNDDSKAESEATKTESEATKEEAKPEAEPQKSEATKEEAKPEAEPKPEKEEHSEEKEDDRYAQLYRQVVADKLSAKLAKAGIDTDQSGSLVDFIDFNKLNADNGELSDDRVQSFIDTVSSVALRKPPVPAKKYDFSTKAEGLAKYLEEK